MPNRLIRDGWVDSERIDRLNADEETFFLRLCLKADDHGRYTANLKLLKASLYPLKDGARDADISRKLAAAEQAGLVRCYEVDNKRYLVIPDFRQRIRGASKYPAPPDGVTCLQPAAVRRHPPPTAALVGVGGEAGDEDEGEGGVPNEPLVPRPSKVASAAPTRAEALQARDELTNKPTITQALAYFANPLTYPEERFMAEEVRYAFGEFNAGAQDGWWMWGKRRVGDWRDAMASRMRSNRERRGGKKPPTNASDALIRAINKV